MNIIITGVAGFIGYHLSKRILKENISLIGIDNMNDYYDVNLKKARLQELRKITLKNDVSFNFFRENINNKSVVEEIFRKYNCEFELMHCVSTYPMKSEDANLQTINGLKILIFSFN